MASTSILKEVYGCLDGLQHNNGSIAGDKAFDLRMSSENNLVVKRMWGLTMFPPQQKLYTCIFISIYSVATSDSSQDFSLHEIETDHSASFGVLGDIEDGKSPVQHDGLSKNILNPRTRHQVVSMLNRDRHNTCEANNSGNAADFMNFVSTSKQGSPGTRKSIET